VIVQVTLPPTLIVVTGVPLASSVHLKFEPFTPPVAGDGDTDAVTVGDGEAGVGVLTEGDGVALLEFVPLGWHDVIARSSAIVSTNPRALSMVPPHFFGLRAVRFCVSMINAVFWIFVWI
jgi:hypothetical protein